MSKTSKTSSFGTSVRVGHDSKRFYDSKIYQHIDMTLNHTDGSHECRVAEQNLNKIFCSSSEYMLELPDDSIHLMLTSPPYNVSKEYDTDLSLDEYLTFLGNVFKETHRVLVNGGRACINIANIGRKPYIPLTAYITQLMLELGFLMRGEIIWDKRASSGVSLAWGSFQSASNPVLRDVHEYILIFSKGSFKRVKDKDRTDSISKEHFMEWSKSIWHFPTTSAKKIGHPAPFPLELPRRLIEFYSFQGDVVLDPFIGSGTTAIAAMQLGRLFVGYEISQEYVQLANRRINEEKNTLF